LHVIRNVYKAIWELEGGKEEWPAVRPAAEGMGQAMAKATVRRVESNI